MKKEKTPLSLKINILYVSAWKRLKSASEDGMDKHMVHSLKNKPMCLQNLPSHKKNI